LSHLYEIYRDLAISKKVFSFICTAQQTDVFPDIDQSYPFDYYIIHPTSTDEILNTIIEKLSKKLDDTIAYILGHPDTCMKGHNYLKMEGNIPLQNLRIKPFWKTGKENINCK
jgi:hypothetical protein